MSQLVPKFDDADYQRAVERITRNRTEQMRRLAERLRLRDIERREDRDGWTVMRKDENLEVANTVSEDDLALNLADKLSLDDYNMIMFKPPFSPGLTFLVFQDISKCIFDAVYEPKNEVIGPGTTVDKVAKEIIASRFPSFVMGEIAVFEDNSWKFVDDDATYDAGKITVVFLTKSRLITVDLPLKNTEKICTHWKLSILRRQMMSCRMDRRLHSTDSDFLDVPVIFRVDQIDTKISVKVDKRADVRELAFLALEQFTNDWDDWALICVKPNDQGEGIHSGSHIKSGTSYTIECGHETRKKATKVIFHVNGVACVRFFFELEHISELVDHITDSFAPTLANIVQQTAEGENWNLGTLRFVGPNKHEYAVDELKMRGNADVVYHVVNANGKMYSVVAKKELNKKEELVELLRNEHGLNLSVAELDGRLKPRSVLMVRKLTMVRLKHRR